MTRSGPPGLPCERCRNTSRNFLLIVCGWKLYANDAVVHGSSAWLAVCIANMLQGVPGKVCVMAWYALRLLVAVSMSALVMERWPN